MTKPTILYVDDEPVNLMLFEANMEDEYNILTAENGESGLETIQSTKNISLVFSDMRMPGMDGLEFIEKATHLSPNIKYYILTGFEITNQIQRALDVGLIRKYFKKPFDMDKLKKEIALAIK